MWKRPFFGMAVAWILGEWTGGQGRDGRFALMGGAVLLSLVLFICTICKDKIHRHKVLSICLTAFLLGGFLTGLRLATLPLLSRDGSYTFTAKVKSVREKSMLLCEIEGESEISHLRGIQLRKEPGMKIYTGCRLSCRASLRRPDFRRNPGGYSEEENAFEKGYGAAGKAESLRILREAPLLRRFAGDLGETMRARLKERLGKSAGFYTAMLLGDSSAQDEEEKTRFREQGLSHLFAVSGLHVAILGMGVFRLLRFLRRSYLFSGLISSILLLFYIILVGMGVSALRAYAVFLYFVIGQELGRKTDSLQALGIAALVNLLTDPGALFGASFLLSYGAVFSLILLEKPIRRSFSLPSGLSATLAANIGLRPLILTFFFEEASASFLWNLFLLPFAPLFLILALLVSLLPALPAVLLLFPITLERGVSSALRSMENFFRPVVYGKPSFPALILYYLLFFSLIFLYRRKLRRFFCIATVLLFFFGGNLLTLFRPGSASLHMLDIGQGQAVFFRTEKGKNCLYDAGSTSKKEIYRYIIKPFLLSSGISSLDLLMVSHMDSDHVNALDELLLDGRIRVKRVVFPVSAKGETEELEELLHKRGIKAEYVRRGDELLSDGAESIKVLHPEKKQRGEDRNDGSLVLLGEIGDSRILLTGDISGKTELALLEKGRWKEAAGCDLLQVPHHGSAYSSESAFLRQLRPKAAFISAGRNRYGHPSKKTLERFHAMRIKALCTKEEGALCYRKRKGRIKISTMRERRRSS